jgi:hypothetical protein
MPVDFLTDGKRAAMAVLMQTQLPLSYLDTSTWTTETVRRSQFGGATTIAWVTPFSYAQSAF